MARKSFEVWMKEVDAILAKRLCGLTSADLMDCMYCDWHEEGVTPKGAASRAIKYQDADY